MDGWDPATTTFIEHWIDRIVGHGAMTSVCPLYINPKTLRFYVGPSVNKRGTDTKRARARDRGPNEIFLGLDSTHT